MLGKITIGKVFYSERDFWPLNTTLYVKDFKGNHPEFVYYFLKTLDYLQYSDKAAVPGVNRNHLHKAWVRVPSNVADQIRIAKMLSVLDRKITLNTQINQTLEQMAQALFKSWFVDFDPVIDNALEAGNPIPEPLAERAARRQAMWEAGSEKAPARLPAETRRLFPDSFEEDEVLGWVPVGWKNESLSDMAKVVYGKNLPTKKLTEKGYPVFGGNGVIGSFSSYLYEKPHTLIACRGAASGKVLFSLPFSFITNNSLVIEHENGPLSAFYLFYSLRMKDLASLTTGSAQPQMTIANMASVQILVAEKSVVDKFTEIVSSWYRMSSNRSRQSESFENLRDTLLPKLLSGELQLPEAEAAVETVLEVMA